MKNILRKAGWIAALITLGGMAVTGAESEGPWDAQFKIRTGLQVANPSDALGNYLLGGGIDVGYTTPAGRFSAEVGYLYKPGRQYLYNLNSLPNPNNLPINTNEGGNSPSTDLRRNQLSAITLRLQYQTWFEESDWGAQAGVELGKMRYRQEYYGHVTDGDPLGNGSGNSPTYEDVYFGTLNESSLKFNVFAGLAYRLSENSHLEFNLRTVTYSNVDYIHVLGTTKQDSLGNVSNPSDYLASATRIIPHLEVSYAIRF
jgi:hypothetical protein